LRVVEEQHALRDSERPYQPTTRQWPEERLQRGILHKGSDDGGVLDEALKVICQLFRTHLEDLRDVLVDDRDEQARAKIHDAEPYNDVDESGNVHEFAVSPFPLASCRCGRNRSGRDRGYTIPMTCPDQIPGSGRYAVELPVVDRLGEVREETAR